MEGEAKANDPATAVPFTLATPPVSVAFDKDWPKIKVEAVGLDEMKGDEGWIESERLRTIRNPFPENLKLGLSLPEIQETLHAPSASYQAPPRLLREVETE